MRLTLFALAASAALLPSLAVAGTVTVVTSFPKEITQTYKAAFEKADHHDREGARPPASFSS